MFLTASALAEFLKKINAKVGGYLWAILAAAFVFLLVILFWVIGAKNKRIRKLKKELKSTRTQLEIERSRAKNEEIFAPVTGGKNVFGEETAERVEFESEPEEKKIAAVKQTSVEEDETERESRKISYYNRPTEVSQKGGNAKFIVLYDRGKDSWVIKRAGSDRVVRRVDTKEEAMTVARMLCKKYDASLVVHKKDGKFQRQ